MCRDTRTRLYSCFLRTETTAQRPVWVSSLTLEFLTYYIANVKCTSSLRKDSSASAAPQQMYHSHLERQVSFPRSAWVVLNDCCHHNMTHHTVCKGCIHTGSAISALLDRWAQMDPSPVIPTRCRKNFNLKTDHNIHIGVFDFYVDMFLQNDCTYKIFCSFPLSY